MSLKLLSVNNMTDVLQYPIHNVLEARARLGEGPVWDATQKLLYWVDIYNHRVHQFHPATGNDSFFDVGEFYLTDSPQQKIYAYDFDL
jgi:sugar lactone lactonase YvrE